MQRYLIKPGQKVNLAKIDTNDSSAFSGDKKSAKGELKKLNKKLEALQELLFAEHKQRVLIVLQAMDTGGKDGVIRHVFEGVNPQGVRVASFKVPTPIELDHDYLWRVHKHTPGRGEIVVFNRSHYEDVLVVRVHELVPETVWSKRYEHINQFERLLADEGTTILKFYLHIDLDEQKERLKARLDDASKHWKFNPDDLKERKLWKNYMQAYEDAISRTSTEYAPWYVVPANRKWYRNLIIASIMVATLEKLNMQYPKITFDPKKIVIE
ncbi:polyphosphate kinase 2 family protein [candidate division KSB1 bacterium]|nr:polyphosphate kinase 2 family protein [candidate division KSB1 bacterium]